MASKLFQPVQGLKGGFDSLNGAGGSDPPKSRAARLESKYNPMLVGRSAVGHYRFGIFLKIVGRKKVFLRR